MGLFGKKNEGNHGESLYSYEPAPSEENTEEEESGLEDFEPFICRKCGQVVTNPFEPCSQHGW